MELSVNISADCYWCTDWLDVALLNEDLLDLFAENSEVALGQDSSIFDCREPLVDVLVRCHLFFVVILNLYIIYYI